MVRKFYNSVSACAMLSGLLLCVFVFSASPARADFPSRVDPPLNWKFALPEPDRTCDLNLKQTAYIAHAEWMRLGGPNGPMGCPRRTQRHEGGRFEVSFDNGAIVLSQVWRNGVLAVLQDGDQIVVDWAVDWFDLPGLNYDKFLVGWRNEDWGRRFQQIDVYADMSSGQYIDVKYKEDTHLRTKGTYRFVPFRAPGTANISIVVKGCDVRPWPLKDTCRQDWFGPVFVKYALPAPPSLNQFAAIDLRRISVDGSVQASRAGSLPRASRGILQAACGRSLPWNLYRNEAEATLVVLAKMAFAEVFSSDTCPGRDIENRKEVAEWLMRQKVESKVGTTMSSVPYRTGEYDVALKGWVALLYAFGDHLPRPVYLHVLQNLLNRRGPVDGNDHWFGEAGVPLPETENHILMIETSRYLTNQLLCEQGLESPSVCDNERNGASKWMLGWLRQLLSKDFIEYNARPYQDYSLMALMNLASYARDERVKTAAQNVLDYVFVKAAASSDGLRRSVPFRRLRSYDNAWFFKGHYDPLAGFLAQLAGNNQLLGDWARPDFAHEMVWAAISEYRIPPPVLDVIVNRESRTFYQSFQHTTTEIYFGSPGYTISGGGTSTGPAYSVLGFSKDEDKGLDVPALFLPPWRALSSREEAVRFDWAPFKGGNICVAPNFACGSNLVIPKTYEKLSSRTEGAWTFINDAKLSGIFAPPPGGVRHAEDALANVRGRSAPLPPATSQPGYYLALYRDQEVGLLEAYDLAREGNTLTFDQFVKGVLARNGNTRFTGPVTKPVRLGQPTPGETINRYVMTDGTVIEFTFGSLVPSIVSLNGARPFSERGLASGSLAESDGQPGFLRIRNPNPKSDYAECELVLDHRDQMNPKREMSGPQICFSGEKVGTFTEYKPCDPVVFVPAPDGPGDRLSQAWGDRGIWDQDLINVQIKEIPAGSGQFEIRIREGKGPGAIEVFAEKVLVSQSLTQPYKGPKYASATGPLADNAKVGAADPGVARGGKQRASGTEIPPPDRSDTVGKFDRPRAGESAITKTAKSKFTEWGFQQSLGISLDKGIRLELDVLCDERLSPRVYGLRYLRFGISGELLVDVMLKFSQPPPR